MGFSKDVKKEILDNKFNSKEHALAFLCGLCYSSAEFEVVENEVQNFMITTEIDFLYEPLKEILGFLFNKNDIQIGEIFKIGYVQYYKISLPNDLAKQALLEIGLLYKEETNLALNSKINQDILTTEEGLKGFVAGTYIGCGTSSIIIDEKIRTSTGYHLEITNQNYELLHEVTNVLAQFEILAKLTKRKNLNVLYIKDAEEVSNVLALMGASNAVLKLQNEIVTRQVRNKINRQNNCFTSNYSKTLNASFNQLQAIKLIETNMGLNNLPEDLQQVALLRLANTEESLEQLLKLSKTPLSKSALNHKFQKLIKIADKFKEKK